MYTLAGHSYFLPVFLFFAEFAFAFAFFAALIAGAMSFQIFCICARRMAFLAIFALLAIVFSVKFKARLTTLLRRFGELTAVVNLENTFSTIFVLGLALLGGGEGDFFALLVGVLGGEDGVFGFFRLGVFTIYYIQMYLLWVESQ
jgi:hypothetical protein